MRLLDRINSPDKLTACLNPLLVSDLDKERVNHLWLLNETLAQLTRYVLRGQPADYLFDPRLKSALVDWLKNPARNPETGYWGEICTIGGEIVRMDDLSTTFHVVSYLTGEVPDWSKIIDTTLAMKGTAGAGSTRANTGTTTTWTSWKSSGSAGRRPVPSNAPRCEAKLSKW